TQIAPLMVGRLNRILGFTTSNSWLPLRFAEAICSCLGCERTQYQAIPESFEGVICSRTPNRIFSQLYLFFTQISLSTDRPSAEREDTRSSPERSRKVIEPGATIGESFILGYQENT